MDAGFEDCPTNFKTVNRTSLAQILGFKISGSCLKSYGTFAKKKAVGGDSKSEPD